MDPTRFDVLTRSLPHVANSRRGVLRLAGAVLLGAAIDASPAAAKQRKKKKCKPPSHAVCDGKCVNLLKDKNNCGSCGFACKTEIPSNPVCVHGACCTNRHGTDCSCVQTGFACDAKTCCATAPHICQNGLCT
jgi:hypothetical protein